MFCAFMHRERNYFIQLVQRDPDQGGAGTHVTSADLVAIKTGSQQMLNHKFSAPPAYPLRCILYAPGMSFLWSRVVGTYIPREPSNGNLGRLLTLAAITIRSTVLPDKVTCLHLLVLLLLATEDGMWW
ncbi:hypothetical protein GJ744_008859 [Endocarpon pusillum]|uniref:Uncharacterized protein n=1 Tax=Endocarpon pusillum TaxID=364733 RepID=A0A8H7E9K2_9EURO|nr:hypothetical protein GJ744_008859 [Endocarpon pusillum]